MSFRMKSIVCIFTILWWASASMAVSTLPNPLPVSIPGSDCGNGELPEKQNPPPDPDDSENPPDEQGNGTLPDGGEEEQESCPNEPKPEDPEDPSKPPSPDDPQSPTCPLPPSANGGSPNCGEPPYHFNPTDAPDSLPSLGERVQLEAVYGSAGPIFRWGRHIGFGSMGRLNYLSKALVTREYDYVRVCNPVDNSVATFERSGDDLMYSFVDGELYDDDTIVSLEDVIDGIPQRLVIRSPRGSSITMAFETDEPTKNEMDGLVYRVIERRTRTGFSTRMAYYDDRVIITDASGHEYVSLLDANDRIMEIYITTAGETKRWVYEYDDRTYAGVDGYVTEINMQSGRKISNWLRGRLVVTDILEAGQNKSKETTYRPGGWTTRGHVRTISRTFPQGRQAKFTDYTEESRGSWLFDPAGLIERIDGLNRKTTYVRNRQRRITEKVDSAGNVWKYEYGGNRDLRRIIGADGLETEFDYDQKLNRTAKRIRLSDTEWKEYRYEYGADGRMAAAHSPEGGEVRYIRNANGKVTYHLKKVDGAAWSATAYTYNGNGQMTSWTQPYIVTDPDDPAHGQPATAFTVTYDAWGNQIARTDELGYTTTYEYNDENRLTAVVDPLGNLTEYEYDGLGQLLTIRDPIGYETNYTYNAQGNITSISGTAPGCGSCGGGTSVDRIDKMGSYAWSTSGLLQSYTDPEGNTTRYAYNANRKLTTVTDPLGSVTRYGYDARNRITSVTDPLGNITTYEYDPAGRLLAVGDGSQIVRRNVYDQAGRKERTIHRGGAETVYEYDRQDRVISYKVKVEEGVWRETRMAYDARGNMVELIQAYGTEDETVTRFAYNAAGKMVKSIIDPEGLAITSETLYDAAGNITRQIDPNGNATTFAYDAAGNIISVLSPEGRLTVFEYDQLGRLVSAVEDPDQAAQGRYATYDAGGQLISESDGIASRSYIYDRAGRRTGILTPGQGNVLLKYDAAGNVIEVQKLSNTGTLIATTQHKYNKTGNLIMDIDESGFATEYRYDMFGRHIKTVNPIGAKTEYEYNELGLRIKTNYPYANAIINNYNLTGDLISQEGGPNGKLEYFYDKKGQLHKIKDANGGSQTTQYDNAGRIIRHGNEMGQFTTYEYDKGGNLLKFTDSKNNSTHYEYDRDGNVIAIIYPAASGQAEITERYQYDGAGRLVCKTAPNGDEIRIMYDLAGNVLVHYYGEEATSMDSIPLERIIAKYERNGVGSVTREISFTTSTLFDYDEYGRMIEAKDQKLGKSVRYGYDHSGKRIKMEVVDYFNSTKEQVEMVVHYDYDNAGRLISVVKDHETATSYQYHPSGHQTHIALPNGLITEYIFDDSGKAVKIIVRKEDSVLEEFSYSYDQTGNVIEINYADGSRSLFEYDSAYRLTRDLRLDANGNEFYDEQYTYDAVGNRLSKKRVGWNPVNFSLSYNAHNQLTSVTGTYNEEYSYDSNGNLIRAEGDHGAQTLYYDVLNRMVKHTSPLGTKEVIYRGFDWHRWQSKQTPEDGLSSTINYLYDGDNIVADYYDDGRSRLYLSPDLDRYVSMTAMANGQQSTAYFTQDAQGTVAFLTDQNGLMIEHKKFTAFGELLSAAESNAPGQRYGYHGREHSSISDLISFRNRSYNSLDGRFIQRDPLLYSANADGNLYTFSKNNPLRYSDPYGLEAMQKWCNEKTMPHIKSAISSKTAPLGVLWKTLSNGKPCKPEMKCQRCTGDLCNTYGYYDYADETIYLCSNNMITNENWKSGSITIAHELIHAAQHLCHGWTPTDCRKRICSEIQAYGYEFLGYPGVQSRGREQILEGVKASVEGMCTNVESIFNSIYEKCYNSAPKKPDGL